MHSISRKQFIGVNLGLSLVGGHLLWARQVTNSATALKENCDNPPAVEVLRVYLGDNRRTLVADVRHRQADTCNPYVFAWEQDTGKLLWREPGCIHTVSVFREKVLIKDKHARIALRWDGGPPHLALPGAFMWATSYSHDCLYCLNDDTKREGYDKVAFWDDLALEVSVELKTFKPLWTLQIPQVPGFTASFIASGRNPEEFCIGYDSGGEDRGPLPVRLQTYRAEDGKLLRVHEFALLSGAWWQEAALNGSGQYFCCINRSGSQVGIMNLDTGAVRVLKLPPLPAPGSESNVRLNASLDYKETLLLQLPIAAAIAPYSPPHFAAYTAPAGASELQPVALDASLVPRDIRLVAVSATSDTRELPPFVRDTFEESKYVLTVPPATRFEDCLMVCKNETGETVRYYGGAPES